MYFQQRMMKQLSSKKEPTTDQEKQRQNMGSMMTVLFTVLFYRFPSSLNLY